MKYWPAMLAMVFCVMAVVALLWTARVRAEPPSVTIDFKPRPKDSSQPMYSKSAFDITPLSEERIKELATTLSPEDAKVILKKGTEPPFCGNLLDNKKDGTYCCKLCGLPLFSSTHKFDSGTGWPSFFAPVDTDHIRYEKDGSLGMTRVEILCARCDGHLGHVFDDGPEPTGLRYCLNSASMVFYGKDEQRPAASQPIKTETAYFAGGCFWGVEDRFQQTPGVINAVSGYMGGTVEKPTYKQVCYTDTGHAEVVKVTYDPARLSYKALVERFFRYHDPTTLNRQGPDVGPQYRSAIFAASAEHERIAKEVIAELSKKPRYTRSPIVTTVQPAATSGAAQFWEAEEYHQDYHAKNGGHCSLPPGDEDEK